MTNLESMHREKIIGKLSTFDRMIFKGHLTGFFPRGSFERFLWRQGVLLRDFKSYVQHVTASIKAHGQSMAAEAKGPFIYLDRAVTRGKGQSKEDMVLEIAERDGIEQGLICVLSTLEVAWSFEVRGNHRTHRLEVVRRKRKCLHFYFYFIDAEFGLMHIRLQSWFPFQIQLYVNGRRWLARQLDQQGIGYVPYENTFLDLDDCQRAQALCERFMHRTWPRVLDAFAAKVNPMLPRLMEGGIGGYYWVLDQAEVATDVMFADRRSLELILPELLDHATLAMGAEDVMRFLGRKLHGNFLGELITDHKKRPEGRRVKHRMKRNSIKIYDKGSVLRVETTINNPREFKVLKVIETDGEISRRWVPMGKGVANLWRYAQVGTQANHRYLNALGAVQPQGKVVEDLDELCRSRTVKGKRYPKLNPVSAMDSELFKAVMRGEHLIHGFRNANVRQSLYPNDSACPTIRRRRCGRVSRLIRKLRGHGLVAKVKNSHLYRVTERGHRLMGAALALRYRMFPEACAAHS